MKIMVVLEGAKDRPEAEEVVFEGILRILRCQYPDRKKSTWSIEPLIVTRMTNSTAYSYDPEDVRAQVRGARRGRGGR